MTRLAKAIAAAKAGFDAVVFDASELPLEQNIRQTKEAVEALKTINPAILVEGEIGDIGSGSEIHKEVPDLSITTPMEAKEFVETTRVRHSGSGRGQHARYAGDDGTRRGTEAFGYPKNCPD